MKKQMQAFAPSVKKQNAVRAWRYYEGTCYEYGAIQGGGPLLFTQGPRQPFLDWDETKKGRRPAVQPLPKRIVEIGAQFLFSEAPRFLVGDQQDTSEQSLQNLLDDILRMNRFYENLLPEARACALDGGTDYKFAWTPDNKRRPVAIHTHRPYEIDFNTDPLDQDMIFSVRVRFKYYVEAEDEWYWYQEVWTKDFQVIYKPLPIRGRDDAWAIREGFVGGEWPKDRTLVNRFGVIPIVEIKNRVIKGAEAGFGDYWESNLYHLFDNYNLTAWLEHYSNQMDADAVIAIINAVGYTGFPTPGEVLNLTGANADVKKLTAENNLREWIQASKKDTRKEIFDAVGYDDVDPALITNKGNLTRAVFEMAFAKSLKTNEEKKSHWEEGLCCFLETMLEGLSRMEDARRLFPALKRVNPDDAKTYDVTMAWPDLFHATPEERTSLLNDLVLCIQQGFLTLERAVKIAAKEWDIQDVTVLMAELKEAHNQLKAKQDAELEAAQGVAKQANMPPQEKASAS